MKQLYEERVREAPGGYQPDLSPRTRGQIVLMLTRMFDDVEVDAEYRKNVFEDVWWNLSERLGTPLPGLKNKDLTGGVMAVIGKSDTATALSAIELICRRSQGRLDREPENIGSNDIIDQINDYLRTGRTGYSYEPTAGEIVSVASQPASETSHIPVDVTQKLETSNWNPLRELGRGGGGVVYLCVDRRLAAAMHAAVAEPVKSVSSQAPDGQNAPLSVGIESLVQNLLTVVRNSSGFAAVKIPYEEMAADRKRLGREVEAMEAFQHPSLIRLLDHDSDDPKGWFAVEYHPSGSLDAPVNRDRYCGKPIDILRALLPLAEALGIVHSSAFVHRDVKPKNIFVASDGHFVLGDFGVVLPGPDATRLTQQGDPAHSRDWVPDWVQFGQDRTYTPVVDVFALAKVAHYLLDGENVMASQMPRRLKDLQKKYAGVPGLGAMLSVLERCIVTNEHVLSIMEGAGLAREITRILNEEESRAQSRPERFEMGQGHFLPISFPVDIDGQVFSVTIGDYYSVTVERNLGPSCQGLRWHGRLLGDHVFDSHWPMNARIYSELERAIDLALWRHRR